MSRKVYGQSVRISYMNKTLASAGFYNIPQTSVSSLQLLSFYILEIPRHHATRIGIILLRDSPQSQRHPVPWMVGGILLEELQTSTASFSSSQTEKQAPSECQTVPSKW